MGSSAKTFKKQIFPLGKHLVSDSKGKRREVEITKEMALDWINKFNAMRSSGLIVTAPWEHDDSKPVTDILNAKNNGGSWKSLYLEGDMVCGVLEAATDEDASSIGTKVNGCSIYVDDYVDGTGKEWDNSILHICLTNSPVAVTKGYEVTENSLSIAMSTKMTKDNGSSTLNELAQCLKSKFNIDLPVNGQDIQEYLKMLCAVFKNYQSEGKDNYEAMAPSMDIFMSTKEKAPEEELSPRKVKELETMESDITTYRKRITTMQKREKALLKHISSSTINSIKNRLSSLKSHYTEQSNEKMLDKLSEMENRLSDVEFEFNFKENSLVKTSIESELDIVENLMGTQQITSNETQEKLVQVTPDDEPEDLDPLSLNKEQVLDIVNSF